MGCSTVLSNFHKALEDRLNKLAAIYLVALFGFIVCVGLTVSAAFGHSH